MRLSSAHQPSPEPAEFDEFYLAVRRRLLLQCLALTGDLIASRSAVRDAFVAARHHWRKVSRLEDPEEWVRPRAWSVAQRRSAARIRHRERGLTDQQAAVLDALAKLPDPQRKTILLVHLAALSLSGIGRELGQTQVTVEGHIQQATTALALALDCDSALIRGQLESLAPLVTSPGLPRVTAIRRSGARRQRWHMVGGSVLAVALATGAGWFVTSTSANDPAPRALTHPVTRAMLLDSAQLAPIAPRRTWTVTETGDNTTGTGINTICQRSRFADDRGLGTWVRKLQASGKPQRQLVQTVEISTSPGAARTAYQTTLGWYAGCSQARVQLVRAYTVGNLGDQAQALRLNLPGKQRRSYVVAIARSGSLTTSTVLRTNGARADDVAPVLAAASTGMRNLCRSSAITTCRAGVAVATPVLPPPSGEVKGMLATADLPPVSTIDKPWIGTDPVPGGTNLAATTCDAADFLRGGATAATSRTFLIPQAKLPERFGLTETYGQFQGRAPAKAFIRTIRHRMSTCEKRQLGSHLSHHVDQLRGLHGSTYSMWRLTTEINAKKAVVSYWMGVARVGHFVAQVNFAPSGADDIDARSFRDLIARARDRLLELRS